MACKVTTAYSKNGEKSILFESLEKEFGQNMALRTWVVSRTANFQKEFGDTKIVDSNGDPLIMYRGTQESPGSIADRSKTSKKSKFGNIPYFEDNVPSDSSGIPYVLNSKKLETYTSIDFDTAVIEHLSLDGKVSVQDRVSFIEDKHAQGIDIAIDGTSFVMLHSDNNAKIAIDINEESDIFQVIKQEANEERNSELEDRLINILGKFGVNVEMQSNLKTAKGVSALGIADIANRIVKVSQDKAKNDTLAEETGHFIAELLGKENPLITRMESLAKQSKEYIEVQKEYAHEYTGREDLILKETVGKLISKALISNYTQLEESKSILDTIKRIWERIKQIFTGFDNKTIEEQIEQVYGRVALDVLNETASYLDSGNLEDSTDIFYQLDNEEDAQEPEIPAEIEKVLTDSEIVIANVQNALQGKIDTINKSANTKDKKAKNIRENLEHLQKLLDGADKDGALVKFLQKAMGDLIKVRTRLRELETQEDVSAQEILRYVNYVDVYNPELLNSVVEELRKNPDLSDVIPEEYITTLRGVKAGVDSVYKRLQTTVLTKTLLPLSANSNLTAEDIAREVKKASFDIDMFQQWSDVLANSPDVLVALGAKLINETLEKVRLEVLSIEHDWKDKLDQFEKFRAADGANIGNTHDLYSPFLSKTQKGKLTGKLISYKEAKENFGEGSEMFKWYLHFADFYLKYQKILPGKNRKGMFLPSIRADEKELLSSGKSIKEIGKAHLKDAFTIQEDDAGFALDEVGVPKNAGKASAKHVPILYHAPIGDQEGELNPDLLSYDLGSNFLSFATMAINNQKMNEIVSDLEILKEVLHDRVVIKTKGIGRAILDKSKLFGGVRERAQTIEGAESNLYKQFNMALNMIVYGEQKDTSTIRINGKDVSTVKLADKLNRYSSLRSLAFNLFSGINNLTMGKTLNWIESYANADMSRKSFRQGQMIYWKSVTSGELLKDISLKRPHSKIGQLNELYDALHEFDQYGNIVKDNKRWKRLMSTNSAFLFQKGGEHELQTTLMLAFLGHKKVKTSSGEEISLLEAYEQVDGKLQLKAGVEYSQEQLIKDTQKLKRISQGLHGLYNGQDLLNMQFTWVGRMALQFRKWLVTSVKRRWGVKYFDERLERTQEGNYRTATKFLWEVRNTMRATNVGFISAWKNAKHGRNGSVGLEPWQIQNLKRTRAELIISMTLLGVISMIAGLDDEDEERSWAANMALYQLYRLKGEMTMYVNPEEALQILKTPAASMSSVEAVIKFTGATIGAGWGIATGDGIPRYERDTGLYEKGDAKWLKPFNELFPGWKEIQAIQVPEDRLKYMLWK